MTVPLVQRSRRCELVFARKYPCQARRKGKWTDNKSEGLEGMMPRQVFNQLLLRYRALTCDTFHHQLPHLGSTWAAAASKVCMQPTLCSDSISKHDDIVEVAKRVEDVAVPSRAARCKGHWPWGSSTRNLKTSCHTSRLKRVAALLFMTQTWKDQYYFNTTIF